MKKRWQWKLLGEVCKTSSGGTPLSSRKEYYEGGDIPWILSGEVAVGNVRQAKSFITRQGLENSAAKLFPKNTVLVAMYGATAGQVGILRFEAATNQAVCGILPNDKLIPEFLFYFLLAKKDELVAQATGNAQPNISQSKIKNTEIPVPSLPEQQRIVGILDKAFAGLAVAVANAEKNLQNARALFESHLQSVFSRQPNEVSLSELATDITDGDHSPPPKAPNGIPFITISDIIKRTREVDFSNTFMVPTEYFNKLKSNKKPIIGDILYTVTGATLGIPVLVKEQRDFCFQRHIGLIRPNRATDSAWLTYALLSPQAFQQATIGATGAAQKTVSLSVLRELKVPNLAISDQKRIANRLDNLAAETQRLATIYEKKLAALVELKQSLLHQAFSGEL
ncbi:MAG: restriction endonuclease subunit S [Myxococcales bacterium]|nr:restriction endonuclease subunit S [Myxococcales bacterium]